ncbi:MAG: AAA family ATPase [Cyanobacteria bacterium]|nr:AAA family ATPase [Cyanobacteriota bacterium]
MTGSLSISRSGHLRSAVLPQKQASELSHQDLKTHPAKTQLLSYPKPYFGNKTAPIGRPITIRNSDTVDDFMEAVFVNDVGQKITGKEILKQLILHQDTHAEAMGTENYQQGTNQLGQYESKFFELLDRQLGFRSLNTLEPVVTRLFQASVIKDLNPFSSRLHTIVLRPGVPKDQQPKIILNGLAVMNYKEEFFTAEVKNKLDEMQLSNDRSSAHDNDKKQDFRNTVFSLPWGVTTQDTNDVEKARAIFDQRFFGIERLKARILEKIAVRQLQGNTKGAIFLLVGPGGTGKTAVAKSIAEALGRRYSFVSLAGKTDAHFINGHQYTYVGSKPGAIIDALKTAGTMNPVIQLDEVDKTGTGRNHSSGDPKDALLAVLDPDHNHRYKDTYLDFPVDLSNTIFVLTANSLEGFPEHFLSRVEVIEFPAYLEEEKQVIAKKYAVPELSKEVALTPNKVVITDEAIHSIIRNYTREGGVRGLRNAIKKLLERSAVEILKQPVARRTSTLPADQIVITPTVLNEWLDTPVSSPHPNKKPHAGEVNGLFYSTIGGGTMPIEVSVMDGTGKLSLTGSLRDVMKEEAQVVVSYLRSHGAEFGISKEVLDKLNQGKTDIHIHYPDTATPKDGPSAGTSTFLALYSALSGKAIPGTIALTGEMRLHGTVHAIGGLREKISGGIYQGITDFIVPSVNRPQVEKELRFSPLFKKLVDGVRVHYVDSAEDILRLVQTLSGESKKAS